MVKNFLIPSLCIPLLSLTGNAIADDLPKPIQEMEDRGVEITGSFDAPEGMKGYTATLKGQKVAIYLSPKGDHALLGTMMNEKGENISQRAIENESNNDSNFAGESPNQYKNNSNQSNESGITESYADENEDAWDYAEQAFWIEDGDENAPRTVYMFLDPHCPYCNKFWKMARPWVDAGKVKIRHVLVGLLRTTSTPIAANILQSDNPEQTLNDIEANHDQDMSDLADNPPEKGLEEVKGNTKLMKAMNMFATPTIIYKDEDDETNIQEGVPSDGKIESIMGSEKP